MWWDALDRGELRTSELGGLLALVGLLRDAHIRTALGFLIVVCQTRWGSGFAYGDGVGAGRDVGDVPFPDFELLDPVPQGEETGCLDELDPKTFVSDYRTCQKFWSTFGTESVAINLKTCV